MAIQQNTPPLIGAAPTATTSTLVTQAPATRSTLLRPELTTSDITTTTWPDVSPTMRDVTTTTSPVPEFSVSQDAHAVVMAGFMGLTLDRATARQLESGGKAVILFGRNITSRDQLRELTTSVACAAGGSVIVAIDQEPGRVDRLATIGVSAPELDTEAERFVTLTEQMGHEMVALGINLDLAPIADVAQGDNPVLEGRNAGPDADVVTQLALDFMTGLRQAGVGATAKHFPGHGLSRVDPHRSVTVIDARLDTLEASHFSPFQAAIDAGVEAVMVGHPIYPALDPDTPASLSPVVLTMLRDRFGFQGVAMTDGLSMAALRKGRSIEQIAVEAVGAGQDLLIADRPSDVPRIVASLELAVAEGLLDAARLSEAANRVRAMADGLAPVSCDG
ncbi:MAG: glycoside hydrolase family 3 protein [Acidimicrobiia bacterium]|nr:glycoside hydrolase family 3 protein [Acidimicrobiia bacterium]